MCGASRIVIENPTPPISIPLAELVKLCAVDSELYAKTFFPKTFRQEHRLMQKNSGSLSKTPLRALLTPCFSRLIQNNPSPNLCFQTYCLWNLSNDTLHGCLGA
jgi:hypothetical protein